MPEKRGPSGDSCETAPTVPQTRTRQGGSLQVFLPWPKGQDRDSSALLCSLLYGICQGKPLTALSGFLSGLIHQTTASFQTLNVMAVERWEGREPFIGLSIIHKFKRQPAPSHLQLSHSLIGRLVDKESHTTASPFTAGLLRVLLEIVP